MSKHINIDNEIRLFKDNIESLRITNIFKNRRINIITALIYYTTIIYIYLLTLSVAFFINPMPYEYFFYGVEMTTNILFLIVLGYRCQDYGIHRYVGIIFVIMVSSLITIWQGGTFFVSPDNFIISITKSGASSILNLNKSYFFMIMNRIILLFLLIPGNKINRYGEQPVNDTLRMYKNDDIRMYNFNCITDTIVEVITTCNTYTLLTVHLL